ncbi:MAG: type IV pili methyl-accepting chemotaxis transducer N-terminal domain-containing protein [Chromatiales bacterium]|nr:type IV pili methyl-accepting chemotaxis transducer N-terminal domain-containing protein [Chromatiales bacterium]
MSSSEREGAAPESGSGGSTGWLAALLTIAVICAIAGFFYVSSKDSNEKRYLAVLADQQVLSQRIAKFSLSAAAGDPDAFDRLVEFRDDFDERMSVLTNGEASTGTPPLDLDIGDMRNRWNALREKVNEIVLARDGILSVDKVVQNITDLMPSLQESAGRIGQVLVEEKADPQQIFLATRQLMLSQRIESNVNNVLTGGERAAAAADLFASDAALFGRVLQGMLRGDADLGIKPVSAARAQDSLQEVALLFSTVSDQAGKIIELAPEVLPAQISADDVSSISDAVNFDAQTLTDRIEAGGARPSLAGIPVGGWLPAVLAAVAILLLILVGTASIGRARSREAETRRREEETLAQNERNQKAILNLLEEISDLADGDLTVEASVTEDFTGAIADSINYAVGAMRELVTSINRTASEVSNSAQSSRATAMHLAEASEHQAEQIRNASSAVNAIAQSADQISAKSTESTEVADRAVAIATKGTDTVGRTIEGMDSIREQIQETSKRIKRLGESSQEIGDIVELIEDIADQTNILALNAAMQAAMAGEAGRGFAVVADEVQRLAERSGNATKQIEALVKTIQSDTHEAVISMEQSTAGVVNGAKLAENAGEALQEIEGVSKYISTLIQDIAKAAGAQAREATSISDTMGVVQEITAQNSDGTNQTAESVGRLAELAEDLQRSVAGFRLPR